MKNFYVWLYGMVILLALGLHAMEYTEDIEKENARQLYQELIDPALGLAQDDTLIDQFINTLTVEEQAEEMLGLVEVVKCLLTKICALGIVRSEVMVSALSQLCEKSQAFGMGPQGWASCEQYTLVNSSDKRVLMLKMIEILEILVNTQSKRTEGKIETFCFDAEETYVSFKNTLALAVARNWNLFVRLVLSLNILKRDDLIKLLAASFNWPINFEMFKLLLDSINLDKKEFGVLVKNHPEIFCTGKINTKEFCDHFYALIDSLEIDLSMSVNQNLLRGLGTALHYAIEGLNVDHVRLLLSHGADPKIKNSKEIDAYYFIKVKEGEIREQASQAEGRNWPTEIFDEKLEKLNQITLLLNDMLQRLA